LEDLQRVVARNEALAENPPTRYQNYAKAFDDQRSLFKKLTQKLGAALEAKEAGYTAE